MLSAGIVLTFGQPRCGAVVPAALLVLYALGTRSPSLSAPALVLAALVFLSFTDPIIGPGALEFFVPLAAGAWAAGRLVRSRNRVARGARRALAGARAPARADGRAGGLGRAHAAGAQARR